MIKVLVNGASGRMGSEVVRSIEKEEGLILCGAARIDGAGRLRQITSITLPLMKTIISLNFILTISGLLKSNLDQTLVLMNSQNQAKAEVIDSYVYRMGMTQGDFSYATAVGLGVSVVSVILLVTANKITGKINEESVL